MRLYYVIIFISIKSLWRIGSVYISYRFNYIGNIPHSSIRKPYLFYLVYHLGRVIVAITVVWAEIIFHYQLVWCSFYYQFKVIIGSFYKDIFRLYVFLHLYYIKVACCCISVSYYIPSIASAENVCVIAWQCVSVFTSSVKPVISFSTV